MKKRLLATFACAAVLLLLSPVSLAFAEGTAAQQDVVVSGETKTIEGDVTTSKDGADDQNHAAAVTATGAADVTVNGNVTSNGVNYSDGVKANDSTVTVNGNVTTTGIVSNAVSATDSTVNVTGNVELGYTRNSRKDSSAVIANDYSTVTIDGNVVVAKGDDHSDGILANANSTVSVTDVTTNAYASTGISAGSDSSIVARNVTVTNDDTTAVSAFNNSSVQVNTIDTNGEGTVGIDSWDSSTVTANSVTVSGKDSIGIMARFQDAEPGLVTVNGNVTASGEGSSAVDLYITNGTVHIAGNATAEQGYGAIFYLASKSLLGYKGAPTLVVDGMLSGTKAPIAIVLDQEQDEPYATIYDLDAYDLPNIIVQSLESGESWVKVLYGGWYEDDDGWEYYELREDTSSKAAIFAQAVLDHVIFIEPVDPDEPDSPEQPGKAEEPTASKASLTGNAQQATTASAAQQAIPQTGDDGAMPVRAALALVVLAGSLALVAAHARKRVE